MQEKTGGNFKNSRFSQLSPYSPFVPPWRTFVFGNFAILDFKSCTGDFPFQTCTKTGASFCKNWLYYNTIILRKQQFFSFFWTFFEKLSGLTNIFSAFESFLCYSTNGRKTVPFPRIFLTFYPETSAFLRKNLCATVYASSCSTDSFFLHPASNLFFLQPTDSGKSFVSVVWTFLQPDTFFLAKPALSSTSMQRGSRQMQCAKQHPVSANTPNGSAPKAFPGAEGLALPRLSGMVQYTTPFSIFNFPFILYYIVSTIWPYTPSR